MSDNRQHGGKRAGAGRKPAPDGTAKVPYGTKLAPIVVEYLRQRASCIPAGNGNTDRLSCNVA